MDYEKESSLEKESHEERSRIREKMSSLSFEELLKIKEEMGLKLYNKTLFGVSRKNRGGEFKRVNKNRPRELSSKLKLNRLKKVLNPTQTAFSRDPRFDPLCGQYDDKTFKDNYKFVNNLRQEEKKLLESELKECVDIKRKNTIKFLIQRMDNQMREQRKVEVENTKKYEEKLDIKNTLKEGKMPIFKKKSVKKLESLVEKFEDLKKANRLQKYIEKKSKKLSSRDRRKLKDQQINISD